MTVKLLIADDHEIVLCGLKNILADSDVTVVAEARTGKQAVQLALGCEPDVVLLDIRMPAGDGLQALGQLKLEKPELPVLMLSAYDNPTYSARAVALGAAGFVMKGASREELLDAIRTAASGRDLWSHDKLRRITGALAAPRMTNDIEVPLTHREGEVLRQMALGLRNKEIAVELKVSYETVKEHVQHILRKIGVTDRTQAAVWAVRKKLV